MQGHHGILPFTLAIATALAGVAATSAARAQAETGEVYPEYPSATEAMVDDSMHALGLRVTPAGGLATASDPVRPPHDKDGTFHQAGDQTATIEPDQPPAINPGCDARNPRDRRYSEVIADTTTTAAIKSTLLWTHRVRGLAVTVDTVCGRVTLRGSADRPQAIQKAGRVASGTRGVHDVSNRITLTEDSSERSRMMRDATVHLGRFLSDLWVTAKIKLRLMLSRQLTGTDIAIDTRNGVVELAGRVKNETDQATARKIARSVHGVSRVDSGKLTYPSEFELLTRRESTSDPFPALPPGSIHNSTARVRHDPAP